MILKMLEGGQRKPIAVLHTINLPYPALEEALSALVYEEVVINDDGTIFLSD